MPTRPWMPLYVADYLADTTHLDAAESGAYLHLIMHYWLNGGLPDNDRQLARIARMTDRQWPAARPVLVAFFHDGWKHKRVDAELARASEVSSKRRAAAEQRHSKTDANAHANASGLDVHLDTHARTCAPASPSPSPSPSPSQRKKGSAANAAPAVYAFEYGIIRLTKDDFDKWKLAFEHIDLAAELIALAPWAEEQGKRWFHSVPNALAKKNREAKARADQSKNGVDPNSPELWTSGIPGVT